MLFPLLPEWGFLVPCRGGRGHTRGQSPVNPHPCPRAAKESAGFREGAQHSQVNTFFQDDCSLEVEEEPQGSGTPERVEPALPMSCFHRFCHF